MSPKSIYRFNINKLKFDKQGLIPAVIQDYQTKDVLMVAYMNKASLRKTLKGGKTCFWSRSRKKFWVKGETSGCFQFVRSIYYDCDMDCILIKVKQKGVACHTGEYSCFYRKIK
jgi:phosphoribosyl-AMP cyclohydrolase